jgi:hypothetical protein
MNNKVTNISKTAGFLEGIHRAEVKATGETVRVVRVAGGEASCTHGWGLKSQIRLYDVINITAPRPACSVCFGYLDPDGACPDARRHEYDAVYAASNDAAHLNRKARRRLAAKAVHLGRLLRG